MITVLYMENGDQKVKEFETDADSIRFVAKLNNDAGNDSVCDAA